MAFDGKVQCDECSRVLNVIVADCLRSGWPTCCGETMRLIAAENIGEATAQAIKSQLGGPVMRWPIGAGLSRPR